MRYLLLFIFCYSCGENNFRKVETLSDFRVLAIVADKPEAAPGDEVDLQVLVSDVNGNAPIISGEYEACIDPGIGRGAPVSCEFDKSALRGDFEIVINDLQPNSNYRTGLSNEKLNLTIPSFILTGRSAREEFNGVSYVVIFHFKLNGKVVKAFKRIVASIKVETNTNPIADEILINGEVSMNAPRKGDKLRLTTDSVPQNYEVINVDGKTETRSEKFQVAWYTMSGELKLSKLSINEYAEFESSEPSSMIIAIMRDERGGVDFVKLSYP